MKISSLRRYSVGVQIKSFCLEQSPNKSCKSEKDLFYLPANVIMCLNLGGCIITRDHIRPQVPLCNL